MKKKEKKEHNKTDTLISRADELIQLPATIYRYKSPLIHSSQICYYVKPSMPYMGHQNMCSLNLADN